MQNTDYNMAKRNKNPLALITGAGRGIGSSIAEHYASLGFDLILIARSQRELLQQKNKLEKKYAIRCNVVIADLSHAEALHQALYKLASQYKRLDVLVNNAGIYTPGKVSEQPEAELRKMLDINLYAAWRLSQWAIPLLEKGRKPLIINIGSIAGLQPYPNGGAYSVSKYALVGFSKNLRNELMHKGIRVSTINPGATWSSSWKNTRLSKSRMMPAEDIAALCGLIYQFSGSTVLEEVTLRPLLGDIRDDEF
jgi:short-subunit dehydrogenase